MTLPSSLVHLAGGHASTAAAIALVAVAALFYARRTLRYATTRPPVAVVVSAAGAMLCTAYSGDTSWRFATDHLGMASARERAVMFAAAELALFSMALMARQNLRTLNAPGTPGVLVWVITGVQVIPAYSQSGLVGGTVRAFVGPILAALLWHLAMGIELRHHKPGADSQALVAVLVREVRERAMSRLGLAVRDRTAEQITRDRWTVRAVSLAARLSELGPKPTSRLDRRHATRLARRLSVAVGRAQVGASTEQRTMLLNLLAARRHAVSLATMDLASPWDMPTDITVVRADTDTPALSGRTADTASSLPSLLPGQARTVPSGVADIAADARADKGADAPLTSTDIAGTAAADRPPIAAVVRSCLDKGEDSPDSVVPAVLLVHPDADIPSVKRTLRRERAKRTNYL